MATYKIIQRENSICILYRHKGAYPVPIGLSVAPEYFNKPPKSKKGEAKKDVEGKWIKKDCPQAVDINATISERLAAFKKHCNRYNQDNNDFPEPAKMAAFFKNKSKMAKTIWQLAVDFRYHQTHKGEDSVGIRAYKQYETACRYLQEFRPNCRVEDISVTLYDKFREWLMTEKEIKCANSVGVHIKSLKTFFYYLNEHHAAAIPEAIISKWVVSNNKTDVVWHPVDEIQLLLDVNVKDKPHLELTRVNYLCQCFTGVRVSDLNPNQLLHAGVYLHKPATKTGEEIKVPIREEIRLLLADYITRNGTIRKQPDVKYNENLKVLGEKAGITSAVTIIKGKRKFKPGMVVPKFKLMTSHVARSTFICQMIEQDVHYKKIMKMTGIKKATTLDYYAAVLDTSLKDSMDRVFTKQALRVTHLAPLAITG